MSNLEFGSVNQKYAEYANLSIITKANSNKLRSRGNEYAYGYENFFTLGVLAYISKEIDFRLSFVLLFARTFENLRYLD